MFYTSAKFRQLTAPSGFAVSCRASPLAPILIEKQRSFTNILFQINDTDDVNGDVPVEVGLGPGPDQMLKIMEEVALQPEEGNASLPEETNESKSSSFINMNSMSDVLERLGHNFRIPPPRPPTKKVLLVSAGTLMICVKNSLTECHSNHTLETGLY